MFLTWTNRNRKQTEMRWMPANCSDTLLFNQFISKLPKWQNGTRLLPFIAWILIILEIYIIKQTHLVKLDLETNYQRWILPWTTSSSIFCRTIHSSVAAEFTNLSSNAKSARLTSFNSFCFFMAWNLAILLFFNIISSLEPN